MQCYIVFECLADTSPISSHLMRSAISPPLLNRYTQTKETNKKKSFETREEKKKFYLKTSSYIGLTCQKGTETILCHVDHSQLDPLPFIIIYTNIVLVSKSRSACATKKKRAILVYVILYGKGYLTGCGLHGYSLASVLF